MRHDFVVDTCRQKRALPSILERAVEGRAHVGGSWFQGRFEGLPPGSVLTKFTVTSPAHASVGVRSTFVGASTASSELPWRVPQLSVTGECRRYVGTNSCSVCCPCLIVWRDRLVCLTILLMDLRSHQLNVAPLRHCVTAPLRYCTFACREPCFSKPS